MPSRKAICSPSTATRSSPRHRPAMFSSKQTIERIAMKVIPTLALLALAAAAVPAHADFTGAFAPANWTTTTTGTLTGTGITNGSATFSSSQLALVGGNAIPAAGSDVSCVGATYAFVGPCQVQTMIGVPGTFSFHWSYLTA